MILFLAGFLLSVLGSLPPGLISLSVAQTAIARTFRAAFYLGLGASVAEFFQAWLAVALSDWFLLNPTATRWFQWGSVPVFLGLAFFLLSSRPKSQVKGDVVMTYSIPGQLARGVIISTFNLLAIPYWFVYCGWLHMEGYWPIDSIENTWRFASGVASGTICVLTAYGYLGHLVVRRSDVLARYANRIVGAIFLILGIKTLLDLWIKT